MSDADDLLRAGLVEMLQLRYRLEVFPDCLDVVRPDGSIAFRITGSADRPFEELRAMVRGLATIPGVAIDWKKGTPGSVA
jgi:hypothetical protein